MGCDGGSIPRRDELVKTKKAAERADPRIQLIATWFFCALSKQELAAPVVSCALGKLYNKDAILEFLLSKSNAYGDGGLICKHVTSFKDVVTLNLTPNPSYNASKNGDTTNAIVVGHIDERPMISRFACPITGREMNGKYRFSYIATCGCVFSEQALKEVPSATCLKCNKAFDPEDVVPINSTQEEEIARLMERMEVTKAQRLKEADEKKRAKKAKKKGKSDGQRKKFKSAEEDDEEDSITLPKRHASNINMPMPDLTDRSLLPPGMRVQSEAIKRIFKKSGQDEGNFLTRGTFNRFAASF
ncbi:Rtf2 RING-finger-domain-containing protein [Gaertneriomyces semiglobifer]|nr:Rtf2 RING-finger-domain-containing protein [Gaertneriomyces semiglobifer]